MRTRLVKPGYFTSETLAELPPLTRLLFIGLWCAANKEGRLLDRPRQLKAQILPYDECDVNTALDELQRVGHIKRYESESLQIIEVINFARHQTLSTWEKNAKEALPSDSCSATNGRSKRIRRTSNHINDNSNVDVNENVDNTGAAAPQIPDFPIWLPEKSWREWAIHRKEKGQKLTPSTIKAQFKELEKLMVAGDMPADVIEQSIKQGWLGLFAIKHNGTNGHRYSPHEESIQNGIRLAVEFEAEERDERDRNGRQI